MAKKYYKDRQDSMNDYNMIKEDPNAFAHLPQEVMSKKYPEANYLSEYYEQGGDYQDKDMRERASQAKKQKLDRHF